MTIKRLAVYCGSAPGADPAFAQAARELSLLMVERGIDLVYGGGRLGLMGIVADTVLDNGGCAYGVIPQALVDHEVAHHGCTELYTVANMHERKAKMTELCDGFVCLPGGIGTLDEMFEAWTWNALGYHAKPLGLLEVDGFYARLTAFLDHLVAERFVREQHRAILQISESPAELLQRLDAWRPTAAPKWVDREPQ